MTTYVVLQTMSETVCLMRTVEWVRLRENTPQWVAVEHDDKGRCRACIRTVTVEMEGEDQRSYLCPLNEVLLTENLEEAILAFRTTFNGHELKIIEDQELAPPCPPQLAGLEAIWDHEGGSVYLIR